MTVTMMTGTMRIMLTMNKVKIIMLTMICDMVLNDDDDEDNDNVNDDDDDDDSNITCRVRLSSDPL